MKRYLILLLVMLGLFVPLAQAQQQLNNGAVQLTGNGNTAYVTAGHALESDLYSVGGTTISLVSAGIPVYIEGSAVSSGGTSAVDAAAFTLSTTSYTPIGCYYQTTVTTGALSTGQAGIAQCDADRRLFVVGAGTAGTGAGGVVSVQGVGSMTPLEVSPTTAANTLSNQFFVQLSDGTHGNTFNSTTYSSKYGADVNILGTLGTAFSTAGKVDVKAADGDVFVRSQAGSTFPVTVAAGTALIGKTVPLSACGTTNFSIAWVAAPTANTAETATTTCVNSITACNTNASTAYTFQATDDQGSPVTVIPATSIPPASCYNWPFSYEEFTSGIKIQASNAAITYSIQGLQ